MISDLSKTDDFIKMIIFLIKTYYSIEMINLLNKTDDFIRNDKFA